MRKTLLTDNRLHAAEGMTIGANGVQREYGGMEMSNTMPVSEDVVEGSTDEQPDR